MQQVACTSFAIVHSHYYLIRHTLKKQNKQHKNKHMTKIALLSNNSTQTVSMDYLQFDTASLEKRVNVHGEPVE